MKLKTFCKVIISAGLFLLFCTFPCADAKAGDTADNTAEDIYYRINYEYLFKSADGTITLAKGDEKANLDYENSLYNPAAYNPDNAATTKLHAFDTKGYYDFKGWYETKEKAEERKKTDQVWSIPSDLSAENKNKDITLYARIEEIVYNIKYKLEDPSNNPKTSGPVPSEMSPGWYEGDKAKKNPQTYTMADVKAGKYINPAKDEYREAGGETYPAALFSGWYEEGTDRSGAMQDGFPLKLPDKGDTLTLYAVYGLPALWNKDVESVQQTVKDGNVALSGMIYPGAQVYAPKYNLPYGTKENICSRLPKGGELLGSYQVRLLCPANPLRPADQYPESRLDVPHVGDWDLILQVAIPGAAAYESDGFKFCQIEADQSFTCIPLNKSSYQGIGSEGTWYEANITAITNIENGRAFAVTGIRREETKPVPDDDKKPDNTKGQGAESDPAKNVNMSNTVKKTKVATGDDSNAGALLAIMACALAAAGASVVMRRGKKKSQH